MILLFMGGGLGGMMGKGGVGMGVVIWVLILVV